MLSVPMRTFPGLFVGRRTVVPPTAAPQDADSIRFVCGACDDLIFTAKDRAVLSDLVVKCRCGEFNQL
ncbi:hypothetical protein DJ021_03490 [Phenylobacterium hankyongense]|jgi:hypothetical protein|uniref:Com family DNA-binding transcriptional regulator n=1 Tax=Phenylobacterium hankyongense TaxID=1813876 RepID=A0A328AV54_9CAUL|nr:hypothetical protein [Phenylobacterium hankyongense]MDB5466514.1 hypothetical protein [Phenylobacterium sp.]RAK58930.1 hypothetical protein DJ021_03490 [Phenylobacterium hankyongense]